MKKNANRALHDLPPEFALEKYADVQKFTILDWLHNLEVREILGQSRPYAGCKWDLVENSRRLLGQPLFGRDPDRDTGLDVAIAPTVTDVTAAYMYWSVREYLDGRYEPIMGPTSTGGATKFNASFLDRLEIPYHKVLTASKVDYEGHVLVKVALRATDAQIKKDFATWLKAARAATKIEAAKRIYVQADLENWTQCRILPYLDLTMWARNNGVRITQQMLGSALFPDEFDVSLAERIRKVIAPMARTMSTAAFRDSLRAQAYDESESDID